MLIRGGQYILTPTNVTLDQDRFVTLVRDSLRFFNKYCPRSTKFNLFVPGGGGGGGIFIFTDDFAANGETLGIPHMISGVVPVRLSGTIPLSLRAFFGGATSLDGRTLVDSSIYDVTKNPYPVEFRNNTLYTPLEGDHDITALYLHQVTSEVVDGRTVYDVPGVDVLDGTYENFFELLFGKFLQALGRSRRAFTIQDLPIQTDASELVAEGSRIEEQTKRDIIENDHAFYEAWG